MDAEPADSEEEGRPAEFPALEDVDDTPVVDPEVANEDCCGAASSSISGITQIPKDS